MQLLKKKKEEEVKVGGLNTSMVKNLEEIKAQPMTRKVTLLYNSCCGCGCSESEISREVPFDSPLKNGDRADTFEDGDEYL